MADLGSILGSAGIGGAIGKAIVSLELETTKYQAELKAAQAETVAQTNGMSSGISKFGAAATAAFAAVGVAAVAGLAYSVNAAIEANDAQLKLQNTFENNPRLADSSAEAFTRQADALMHLTGVDDEAIISSQAMLGQFDLTGQEVLKLTPLIVDLSEKMGISLETAVKAVGKATQGNTGSLARYGIAIDETSTSAGALAATVEGLGVAQGFAEDSADAEPWRVLRAEFEELAEALGQKLLPALQGVVEAMTEMLDHPLPALLGPVGQLADSIQDLGNNFDEAKAQIKPLAEATVELGRSIAEDAMPAVEDFIPFLFRTGEAADGATTDVVKFAHMTGKELKEWSESTKESFESYVLNLDKVQEETDFTRTDLRDSFRAMLEHARDLNQAMRTLSREHWINDDFVKFLAEQPDKLILFADSNERQQRRMQDQWAKSGEILKNQVNDRLDVMTGVLDHLDNQETKHTVRIKYEYEGFDPSKPGMNRPGPQ